MATKPLVETKPWYLSKGVMGSAGGIISGILGMWYTGFSPEDLTTLMIAGGTFVSGLLALIGRITAKSQIG